MLAALTQENATGHTPLDLALSCGKESTSSLLAFIGHALSQEDMQILLGGKDLTTKALAQDDTALLEWIFDANKGTVNNQHKAAYLGEEELRY